MTERITFATASASSTSGGGGSGLCSDFRGVCTEGPGVPEDRGSLYHAVELAISEAGESSLRVIQACGT